MQLPEQLAEIDHIFCDKTGTLTKNELLFGALSIQGQVCDGANVEQILVKARSLLLSYECKQAVEMMFKCICLCNDASFVRDPVTNANKAQGSS